MISAIMSTYNRLPYLKLAVRTFKQYSMPETELHVHVDGSTDGTVDWLERVGVKHTVDEHIGAPHGYNVGASHAEGEWLRIINDDNVFSPGWDKGLLRHIGQDKVLASKAFDPETMPPFGDTLGSFDEEGFLAHAKGISINKTIPWGLGGSNTFSRERFEEIGGFDEAFNPYTYADTDFLFRLKTKYPDTTFLRCEDSIIYHFHLRCKDQFTEEERAQIGRRAREYFIKKWGATPQEVRRRLSID